MLFLVICVMYSCVSRSFCLTGQQGIPENSIETRLKEMERMLKYQSEKIQSQDKRMAILEDTIQSQDKRMAVLEDTIQSRDKRIAVLEDTIQSQDKRMAILEDTILSYKSEISEHKIRLQEKETFSRERVKTINKQEKEIANLKSILNAVSKNQDSYEMKLFRLRDIILKERASSDVQNVVASSEEKVYSSNSKETKRKRLLENSLQQPTSSNVQPVAFYAYLETPETYPDTHHVLIYNTIKTDSVGAYSKFTGIFTVPVDGIYGFLYTFRFACHINNAFSSFELVKNNVVEGTVLVYDHGCPANQADQITVTGSAIIQANQGDKVYVRTHSTFPLDGSIVSDFNGRTSFAGWLIR